MKKRLVILGSTGSIGTQTLDVVRMLNKDNENQISVVALCAGKNISLLEQQIREFKPLAVSVEEKDLAENLKIRIQDTNTKVFCGKNGLLDIILNYDYDLLLNALVGSVGLVPTIEAIRRGKDIALANKETLVMAGELVTQEVKKHNVKLLPVDSEHSAIFQALQGNDEKSIEKIYLTASGGPFRNKCYNELKDVTVGQALSHPNWSMGRKISTDSATMLNKGLEIIEAMWLFNQPLDKIHVLIHPQSIIHSMIQYVDGAVIAQMGAVSMHLPIQYAITYPMRLQNSFERCDFDLFNKITFEQPNEVLNKGIELAIEAAKKGKMMPAVLNAANEVAVSKFLNEEIKFLDIYRLIEEAMSAYNNHSKISLEEILEADSWARSFLGSKY